MSINELFNTNNQESTSNARTLTGTAELTKLSAGIATSIIRKMEENIDDYRERIAKSATDSNELDDIISELGNLSDADIEFLKEIDENTIENMLKSQQSKRSRTKGKTMTLDNYRSLMTAAIAETLIRMAWNKPKSAHGGFKRAGIVDYTPAQLEELASDQDALRREIRNVQSKKSIMKSKIDFDESDERWQSLLKAEVMLKDLRVGGRSNVIEVDHTKDKLAELLGEVDVDHLKAADSKELLETIANLIK
jgi:hypothetical protein